MHSWTNLYPSMLFRFRLWLVPLLLILLTACADPRSFSFSTVEQYYLNADPSAASGNLSAVTTLRQSFLPTYDGLHRVAVVLANPTLQTEGTVTVRVLDDNQQSVFITTVPLSEIANSTPKLFLFDPQPDSALRVYTVELSTDSATPITAQANANNLYTGELIQNEAPQSGDLLLEWGYKPTIGILASDLGDLAQTAGVPFVITALLWTLPGLAILAWLRRNDTEPLTLPFLLAAALAIGGALLVVIPQLAWWFRLPLGAWAVWVLLLVSVGVLGVAWRRRQPFGAIHRPDGMTMLYGVVLLFVVLSRLFVIHPLAAPQWGDSVHHSLITQLLLDKGGIFDTYEPYLPLAPFTYHAGFHLLSMWFGWSGLPGTPALSGMDAILWGGQWQNIVAVVMVGLLAEGLVRPTRYRAYAPLAGVVALLVTGLLNEMPAFYLNWGRYTQLAGQLFLPPALLWSITTWHSIYRRRWLVVTVLVVSALALTHYRVLIMYAAALPFIVLYILWREREGWRQTWLGIGWRTIVSGLATLGLILPWYWKLQQSVILQRTQTILSASSLNSDYVAQSNPFGDLTQFVPQWFWVAAGIGFVYLFLRRQAVAWLIGGWLGMLFLVANPALLRLPGTGLVDNFMLQISLYLPLAVLVAAGISVAVGDGVAWLTHRVQKPLSERITFGVQPLWGAALILAVGVGAWGTWQQLNMAETRWYAFVTRADERAADWITTNTSTDSVFHVNGFFAYYDTTVAGSDAGEWLWLTAHRTTTVPPMIYAHEAGIDPDYRAEINDRYHRLEDAEQDPDTLAAVMRAEGVDYVYVGAQQGIIGKPPDDTPLDPWLLEASGDFETVYSDGVVWVLKVREIEETAGASE